MLEAKQQLLARLLRFALRHQPHRYGVALDQAGFASLNDLVIGIRFSHLRWTFLEARHVLDAVRRTDPERFEVADGRIRARYGHSVRLGEPGELRTPPSILLHGTAAESLPDVLATGLRAMSRAFVHLTTDRCYAEQVAAAKGGGAVLRVRAKEASDAGARFFQANKHVWLCEAVGPEYLELELIGGGGG